MFTFCKNAELCRFCDFDALLLMSDVCTWTSHLLICKSIHRESSLLFRGSLFVVLTVSTKFHGCSCRPSGADGQGSDSLKMISSETSGNWESLRAQLISHVHSSLTWSGFLSDIIRSVMGLKWKQNLQKHCMLTSSTTLSDSHNN